MAGKTRKPGGISQPTLTGLQVARGLAALSVTLHHALETSNGVPGSFSPDWLTTGGAGGVDIFFVISGFIMAHTTFRPGLPTPTAAAFLQRRATRIYPLYWLACLAMLSLMALGFFQSRVLSSGDVFLALALLPGGQPIIGVAWTLVYEIYFYLILAVCLALRRSSVVLWATSSIMVAILVLAQGLPESGMQRFLSDPIPLEFLLGIGLATVYPHVGGWLKGVAPASLLVFFGLALLYTAPLMVPHETTHGLEGWARVAAWGVAGLAIVAGLLVMPERTGWLARLLNALGNASYALYLTHIFVLMGYGLALRKAAVAELPQYLLVIPVVLLACLVGGAAHVWAERPLLRLARLTIDRARPSRRAAVAAT